MFANARVCAHLARMRMLSRRRPTPLRQVSAPTVSSLSQRGTGLNALRPVPQRIAQVVIFEVLGVMFAGARHAGQESNAKKGPKP